MSFRKDLQNLQLKKTSFPSSVEVELATRYDAPPTGEDWLHETKFDGYRIIMEKRGASITLLSRQGKDWTDKFSTLRAAAKRLPVKDCILDGELCVLGKRQTTDFQSLQNYLSTGGRSPLIYFAFDLLYIEGYDLRTLPLLTRKKILTEIIPKDSQIRESSYVLGHGAELYKAAQKQKLEGIISKRVDSKYLSGRTREWRKIKIHEGNEFLIIGMTPHSKLPGQFGSLLLGYFEGKALKYCGKVGTGFTAQLRRDLWKELLKRRTQRSALESRGGPREAIWVKPELIAQVDFTEWTSDGRLRHPSFKGLRLDKKPKEVHREIIRHQE